MGYGRPSVPWLDLWPKNDLYSSLILRIDDVPNDGVKLICHKKTKNIELNQ